MDEGNRRRLCVLRKCLDTWEGWGDIEKLLGNYCIDNNTNEHGKWKI